MEFGHQRHERNRSGHEGHVGERTAVGLGGGRLGRGEGRSVTAKSLPNVPGAVPTKSAMPWSRSTLVYEPKSGRQARRVIVQQLEHDRRHGVAAFTDQGAGNVAAAGAPFGGPSMAAATSRAASPASRTRRRTSASAVPHEALTGTSLEDAPTADDPITRRPSPSSDETGWH